MLPVVVGIHRVAVLVYATLIIQSLVQVIQIVQTCRHLIQHRLQPQIQHRLQFLHLCQLQCQLQLQHQVLVHQIRNVVGVPGVMPLPAVDTQVVAKELSATQIGEPNAQATTIVLTSQSHHQHLQLHQPHQRLHHRLLPRSPLRHQLLEGPEEASCLATSKIGVLPSNGGMRICQGIA